jgi:hypothetical protein
VLPRIPREVSAGEGADARADSSGVGDFDCAGLTVGRGLTGPPWQLVAIGVHLQHSCAVTAGSRHLGLPGSELPAYGFSACMHENQSNNVSDIAIS